MDNCVIQPAARDERGFAALALVMVLVPLLFLVGSYLQTMSGRNGRLQLELKEERALMVAESGLDRAIFEGQSGVLAAGHLAVYKFTGTLAGGGSFETLCTYLGDDDDDNDRDGDTDEPDEDVFCANTVGSIGDSQRRIAAYLGFSPFLATAVSPLTVVHQNPDIRISGTGVIDGHNYTLGGALVGSGDALGLTIVPPATSANLLATLSPAERTQVRGSTPTPSIGTSSAYSPDDVDDIVTQARNAAQIVFTNTIMPGGVYGTVAGPQYIIYREGNLRITGNFSGAGLLVINGDLDILGTMVWSGVVICTGRLSCGAGTARILGGVVVGELGNQVDLRGTVDLRYSSQAILLAQRLTGRYVAFNGWQEIGLRSTL